MLTLPRFFALAVGLLAVIAALVLALAVRSAGRTVIATGEAARLATAGRVASAVEADLGAGERAVEDFEHALRLRLFDAGDTGSLRRYLTSELLALRGLTELTLTTGRFERYDDDGAMVLAADGRRQVSVFRERTGVVSDLTLDHVTAGSAADPTAHPTFETAANREWRGRAVWSDLAFSQLDAHLPPAERRKALTIQKAIFDLGNPGRVPEPSRDGLRRAEPGSVHATHFNHFVGVLRAGISAERLDQVGLGQDAADQHRIFICDSAGRLVTRLSPDDAFVTVDLDGRPDPDGDLRAVPRVLPPPVAAALSLAREGGTGGRVVVGGVAQLVTLAPIAEGRAQNWRVGVVVPESAYVGGLAAERDRLLALLAAVVAAIAAVGVLGARAVGRGVGALVRSTEAMHRFSFAPTAATSSFAEVRGALQSVERAKTALRAMVKYVPVGLVRRLYESGREPVLGAELTEVSLMFSDIESFTTHAESLAPARLSEALGRYLETATRAVEQAGGTVDKYIGDALMVIWNAPDPVVEHARAACRGALACAAATEVLGVSDWWRAQGLPPWRTRFGLHTDRVLVGHFGAPDRLSYTAMGDGVNLAARLEGLNKAYGTTILVSEQIRAAAGPEFVFRQVDRVAVKGKTRGGAIYELVGAAGDPSVEAKRPILARYEEALAAAFARQFTRALDLCGTLGDDGVAKVLATRCKTWLASPPPEGWDGTWTAREK
jgi:adenylate cyclase